MRKNSLLMMALVACACFGSGLTGQADTVTLPTPTGFAAEKISSLPSGENTDSRVDFSLPAIPTPSTELLSLNKVSASASAFSTRRSSVTGFVPDGITISLGG